MSQLALKKILESAGDDIEHFLSTFATDLLLTQALAYDASGNTEYVGYALPGTGKGASTWLIKKLSYDASQRVTDVQFADGEAKFTRIWNDRSTAYTYS